MNTTTKPNLGSAVQVLGVMAEAIRELGEIPSGHLYAMTMGSFENVQAFESAVRVLKGAGLVSESGHVLRWCGPNITAAGKSA